jgi:hypothetical protein
MELLDKNVSLNVLLDSRDINALIMCLKYAGESEDEHLQSMIDYDTILEMLDILVGGRVK